MSDVRFVAGSMLLGALVWISSGLAASAPQSAPSLPKVELKHDARSIRLPRSFEADCSADVTDRLTAWFAAVPDGSEVVLQRDGCYELDRRLVISGHHDLTIDGNGATLRRKVPTPPSLMPNDPANVTHHHNQHVQILDSSGITIHDLRIEGLNTASDIDREAARQKSMFEPERFGAGYGKKFGEAGIIIVNSDDVTLSRIAIDGVFGDGISVGNDNVPISHRILVKDVTIDRNGRQGVSFSSVDGVVLDNVKVLHSHAVGFDLEPIGVKSFVRGVEIRNSYVNTNTVAFSLGGVNNVSDVNIHDNVVRHTLASYPWFLGNGNTMRGGIRRNWTIANNVVESPSQGIVVKNTTDVTIERNRQIVARKPDSTGIAFANVSGKLVVRYNELLNATRAYSIDEAGPTIHVTACGNRLKPGEGFDFPVRCPG